MKQLIQNTNRQARTLALAISIFGLGACGQAPTKESLGQLKAGGHNSSGDSACQCVDEQPTIEIGCAVGQGEWKCARVSAKVCDWRLICDDDVAPFASNQTNPSGGEPNPGPQTAATLSDAIAQRAGPGGGEPQSGPAQQNTARPPLPQMPPDTQYFADCTTAPQACGRAGTFGVCCDRTAIGSYVFECAEAAEGNKYELPGLGLFSTMQGQFACP